MPSSLSLLSLAAKLCKAARPQPLPPAYAHRCFSSKVKARGKRKGREAAAPSPPATTHMKKPHWSELVSYKVSSRLSSVLQASELTRPEAVCRIWSYIKSNNLQNASEEIVCDEALEKAFGQAKLKKSDVPKYLSVNLARLRP